MAEVHLVGVRNIKLVIIIMLIEVKRGYICHKTSSNSKHYHGCSLF